jgi:translation initiation factor 6
MIRHLDRLSINGNPNIGLYGYATDKYCLISHEVSEQQEDIIHKILKVPVHRISIAGTSMIGAFCAGNNSMLLVPGIIFDHEIRQLKKLNIPFTIIETKLTALGNNIVVNDNGCMINPGYLKDAQKAIEKALNVPVNMGKISGFENVGSLAAVNDKGCYVHNEISDHELKALQDLLNVDIDTGTINMGNPYLRSGILANSFGLIVGELSSGIEIAQADRALGFLKR